jgi:rubrerythrin
MQQDDYKKFDRIWQRVAPTLNPYPEVRSAMATEDEPPAPAPQPPVSATEMLAGFIEQELSDRRFYLCYAHHVNGNARRAMREMGLDEEKHARRMMALYQMMTGECYAPTVSCGMLTFPPYCQVLRERYQEETGGAFHYTQAAQEVNDACLSTIFQELAADEKRHARTILCLMEQSISPLA